MLRLVAMAALIGLVGCNGEKANTSIKGLFSIHEEYSTISECEKFDERCRWSLDSPKACWFDYYTNNAAASKVNAALESRDGFGTFFVEVQGVKTDTPDGAGHLGLYKCEIVANDIVGIKYVELFPPPPE